MIAISKDINATSGINGTATISQVINTVSTPEPTSRLLLGSGLLGLGATTFRRFRRAV